MTRHKCAECLITVSVIKKMSPRDLVQVLLLAGFLITVIYGNSDKLGLIGKRSKRGFTAEAAKGLLAWRKLLRNSKPGQKAYSAGFNRYYKEGVFENALKDFLSVVPANKNLKQQGDIYKGRIYVATVGDMKVVLRERGIYGDIHPTIEISNGHTKDKIIYRQIVENKRQKTSNYGMDYDFR